jgi:CelD/BcsL family acetyltransferase involved in cellulose biosynthesis
MTRSAQEQGRRRRRRDTTSLSVTRISTFAEAEKILGEWHELHSSSASGNPFTSPDWLMPWARHFVSEHDLALSAVWRHGLLVGLAPWYLKRTRPWLRRLQVLGSGRHDALTELPAVLTAPGEARSVLRAVLDQWSQASNEWDWLELPMLEGQGWLEPEWLTGAVGALGLVQHKVTRAAVVLELPHDVPTLHQGLKRNLLESIHRGRNRLDRTGSPWVITSHQAKEDVRHAVSILARLQTARSAIAGRRHHPDQLAAPGRRDFLDEALTAMAQRGQAEILTLDVADHSVAAQMVLHAPGATYLGLSGVDPAWWHVSAVTLLQLHAAEGAVTRGDKEFNLSVGPDVAKLRWSQLIRQHPEFLVCGPRRSSRGAFTAFRVVAAAASVHREAMRHRTTPGASRHGSTSEPHQK